MTNVFRNFIDGEYRDSHSGQTSDIFDPATGQVYAKAAVSNAADVDDAFRAADRAFEQWSQTTPAERQLALLRIADSMAARAEEIADVESRDTGKPRPSLVGDEVMTAVGQVRFFAGAARNLEG